ncbi:MazG nucleotide pyrophosphohydrolase domain-containing protein [Fimbriiglobus ruber]|uniref:Uncharacterized protein n=1 Tax=Fimbriiglobus ruber TaxID=1908690 RepID=A0A225DGC3_9BACT|nr:MazG nucleotide pyrophosphohydrolase domain-containing protein [Fimbriiglobus ruber]OWK35445.1 hypothetical protein FRUB_08008 [Fimbriiglobus ruber]
MTEHFNKLTEGEAELLALLAEEMGEAIQIIGKILRHGYDSTHPDEPFGPDNREILEKELGDVRCAMILLCEAGDLRKEAIHRHADDKRERVGKYLHHQPGKEAL